MPGLSPSIHAGAAPKAVGHYPHARRVGGLLWLSGIGPRTPGSDAIPGNVLDADGRLLAYDIVSQCRAVFANVRAVLDASGARWEDLVDVTVYLTDMARDFQAYNGVWAEYFPDPARAPCRTTLGITALPTPIAIELKCIAQVRDASRGGTPMLGNAFHLQSWIDDHRHLLKPPVGNKCIVQGDYIVMVVGGPNQRDDFHVEEGPEWFQQLEGEMLLRVQEDGGVRDILIRAGECFYLPPRVPHSPQRKPGSVGLVIERRRLPHELDALRWYCPSCNHLLYEESFALVDIENQFAAVFERFYRSPAHRTCARCGHLHPAPAHYDAA